MHRRVMWNFFSQAVGRLWDYDAVAWISTYEFKPQHQAGLRAAGLSKLQPIPAAGPLRYQGIECTYLIYGQQMKLVQFLTGKTNPLHAVCAMQAAAVISLNFIIIILILSFLAISKITEGQHSEQNKLYDFNF